MSTEERRWLEVSARCSRDEQAPLLVEGLLALGGRAAEERDGWYLTHVPAPPDLETFVEEARSALRSATGGEEVDVRAAWIEHEDWAETWKRGIRPRAITERILVRPSWSPSPAGAPDVEIVLDPGMAFGTAEHGTTRGSLRLLDRVVVPGDTVLDVGSGSGILAIAAALLGAAEVVAFEADELALEALAENLERNAVATLVRCVPGLADPEAIIDRGPASGVVANIESRTLMGLMRGFAGALRPGGWLILSGIQRDEWPVVRNATESAGFRFVDVDTDGEWRSGLFERD